MFSVCHLKYNYVLSFVPNDDAITVTHTHTLQSYVFANPLYGYSRLTKRRIYGPIIALVN